MRLSCAFYTYILFAKEKYIIGTTCAQIFTDGEGFVYVQPVRYKSQAGEDLNVITRDIEVPNTLISYNAGGHMVQQTELHKYIRLYCINGRRTEP